MENLNILELRNKYLNKVSNKITNLNNSLNLLNKINKHLKNNTQSGGAVAAYAEHHPNNTLLDLQSGLIRNRENVNKMNQAWKDEVQRIKNHSQSQQLSIDVLKANIKELNDYLYKTEYTFPSVSPDDLSIVPSFIKILISTKVDVFATHYRILKDKFIEIFNYIDLRQGTPESDLITIVNIQHYISNKLSLNYGDGGIPNNPNLNGSNIETLNTLLQDLLNENSNILQFIINLESNDFITISTNTDELQDIKDAMRDNYELYMQNLIEFSYKDNEGVVHLRTTPP